MVYNTTLFENATSAYSYVQGINAQSNMYLGTGILVVVSLVILFGMINTGADKKYAIMMTGLLSTILALFAVIIQLVVWQMVFFYLFVTAVGIVAHAWKD